MTQLRVRLLVGIALSLMSLVCSVSVHAQGVSCTADIDGDGMVGGQDLAVVLAQWATADPVADLNGSGLVNGQDLAILLSQWGFECQTNPFCESVEVEFVNDMMVITTSGLPCHATGPFDGTYYDPYTGQYCFNPNTPTDQNNVWMIPSVPIIPNTTSEHDLNV